MKNLHKLEQHIVTLDNLIDRNSMECKKVSDLYDLAKQIEVHDRLEAYVRKHQECDALEEEFSGWEAQRVEAELRAASMYLDRYRTTKLEKYKKIAQDELEHATTIMSLAMDIPIDNVEDYRRRIQAIAAELVN